MTTASGSKFLDLRIVLKGFEAALGVDEVVDAAAEDGIYFVVGEAVLSRRTYLARSRMKSRACVLALMELKFLVGG